MGPAENCTGVAGLVSRSTATVAEPVHIPFTDIASSVRTSENRIFPEASILCILIKTPCRIRNAVTFPTPDIKVTWTFAGEMAPGATLSESVSTAFFLDALLVAILTEVGDVIKVRSRSLMLHREKPRIIERSDPHQLVPDGI